MNNHNFSRNYSENDLKNLINEKRKKADYINRIIDSDIHINMISESNLPLNEKIKYSRINYNINNKNHFNKSNQKYNNINNNLNIQNKYLNKAYNKYTNNDNDLNYKINNIDNIGNIDINYNFNNSLNINKPFHCERRHFPLVNNKGNFFKNMTPFLIGNTQYLNKINLQKNNYNKKNNDNQNTYREHTNILKRNEDSPQLKRSSSMDNIPLNHFNIRNNIINLNNKFDYSENMVYSMGDVLSNKYKFYNPRRYDYEGSRYGDHTYNYYLNSPMRSDISSDWRFPPLYYYNSINEHKKNY